VTFMFYAAAAAAATGLLGAYLVHQRRLRQQRDAPWIAGVRNIVEDANPRKQIDLPVQILIICCSETRVAPEIFQLWKRLELRTS